MPEPVAVVEDGRLTTWAELRAEIDRVAAGLAALGRRAGDRAVWCRPNSRQVVVLITPTAGWAWWRCRCPAG